MAIPIENLRSYLEFIQRDPATAHRYVDEWHEFSHDHPETELFESRAQWDQWINDNPEYSSSREVWRSREVAEAYHYAHEHTDSHPEHHDGHGNHAVSLSDGLAPIILALSLFERKEQTTEDHYLYKKLLKEELQKWIVQNPDKTTKSPEWMDFVYGTLDSSRSTTVAHRVVTRIDTEYPLDSPDRAKKKARESFEKVRAHDHTAVKRNEAAIETIAKKRYNALQQAGIQKTYDEVLFRTKQNTWDTFVDTHPEVANEYAHTHVGIKTALARKDLERQANTNKEGPQTAQQLRIAQLQKKKATQLVAEDQELPAIEKEINQVATSVVARKQSAGIMTPFDTVRADVAQKRWDEYVRQHPQKAAQLRLAHEDINAALQRKEEEERRKRAERNKQLQQQKEKEQQQLSLKDVQRLRQQLQQAQRFSRSMQPPSRPRQIFNRPIQSAPNVTGRVGNTIGRTGARAAGSVGKAAGRLGSSLARPLAAFAAESFPVWGPIVGVLILILLVVFVLFQVGAFTQGETLVDPFEPTDITTIPGLSMTVDGPDAVGNAQAFTYTLTITYSGTEDIAVYDILDSKLDGKEHTGTADVEGNRLTWYLKKNTPLEESTEGKKYIFTRTVQPTIPDISVRYTIYAKTLAAPVAEGENAPNQNDCNGLYKSFFDKMLARLGFKKNFGDPTCGLRNDPNKIAAELQQADPENAAKWLVIAACESGYNANAFNPVSTSGTAWGLFQMNPQGRGNGLYDQGDVPWQQQITNAVNYNKRINGSFRYWDCARQNGWWK